MSAHQVKLHIRGTQSDGPGEAQTISDFFIDGTLATRGQTLTLRYREPTEHGLGDVETVLRYDGQLVALERNGKNGLLIEAGRRHICQYRTPLGDIYIGVNGGEIKMTREAGRLDMEIDYAIDVNTSFAARNNIKITAVEQ